MARLFMEAREGSSYVGVDISESSLRHAERGLVAAGCEPDRFEFVLHDATDDLPTAVGSAVPAVVCCEVLEHVDEPERIAAALHGALEPGGLGFVTTVANLEAEDHVYLFDDADQIRSLLTDAGFTIIVDHALPLPGAEDRSPLPLNYCATLQRPIDD